MLYLEIAPTAYDVSNVGIYEIEIRVEDDNSVNAASGVKSAITSFTLEIIGVNRVPTFTVEVPDLKLAVNETYFFSQDIFSDPDEDDTHEFSLESN